MKKIQSEKSPFELLFDYQPAEIAIDETYTKETIKPFKNQIDYFLAGNLKNATRNNENLLEKQLVVLDYDGINMLYTAFLATIQEKLKGLSFILYPTISNYVPGLGLRFRLVIDTDRAYTENENKRLLQNVINMIEIPCDAASQTYSQLMGLPVLNQLSSHGLITKQREEPLKVDDYLFEPVQKRSYSIPTIMEGNLTHENAVAIVQAYANRVGEKLLNRDYYLNPYMNIKYAYEQRELELDTVEECLTILALGNDDWATSNIEHFKRDTTPVISGTPFTQFFGWAVSTPQNDFDDFDWVEEGSSESCILNPLHISIELTAINKSMLTILSLDEQAVYLTEALDGLNEATPDWFWCKPNIKKDKDGKVTKIDYNHGYNHVAMGNYLIGKYYLIRYPKLREGAVYNSRRGYWRYFGKNEMKDFSEKETLRILEKWGYYDIKHITPTRIYILQKTYDDSFPEDTPFLKSNPALVVFKNGTYNILTNEMKSNDPNDYILNAHNYNLDTSGRETPHIEKLLIGLVGDAALFVKQYIGYLFYRSHAPAQEMLFFKGDGGEGKSTFINFIAQHLIGDENVAAISPQELTEDKFSRVELLGKSVNLCADIPEQFIEDSTTLKRLTGCDRLLVQYKGIQGFFMISYAKMIYSANKLPSFKDLSGGFSDRLAVVKFINGNQRKEGATFWKNHDMKEVEKEATAFAYTCIQEFRKVFNGRKVQFTKPESVTKETSNWLFENDHIGEFVAEATKIHIDETRGEIASRVHNEYQAFCKESGYYPKSSTAIKHYLESKGIPKLRSRNGFRDGSSNQWRYIGLELTTSFIYPDLPFE